MGMITAREFCPIPYQELQNHPRPEPQFRLCQVSQETTR